MTFFTNPILNKLYWPLMVIYIIVLLAFVMLYFTEINNWSDRAYYNLMNFRRIGIVAGIILTSLYLKYNNNPKISNMILFVPAFAFIVFLVLALFVMYLFSKSVPSK